MHIILMYLYHYNSLVIVLIFLVFYHRGKLLVTLGKIPNIGLEPKCNWRKFNFILSFQEKCLGGCSFSSRKASNKPIIGTDTFFSNDSGLRGISNSNQCTALSVGKYYTNYMTICYNYYVLDLISFLVQKFILNNNIRDIIK